MAAQIVAKGRVREGDVVVVTGHRVGEVERTGEILQVLGVPERQHFVVRWEDGHESVFYPGGDAIVHRPRPRTGKTTKTTKTTES
jgi:hypothetical protein